MVFSVNLVEESPDMPAHCAQLTRRVSKHRPRMEFHSLKKPRFCQSETRVAIF